MIHSQASAKKVKLVPEHDRLVVVNEDSVLQVPRQGPGEHGPLEVPPLLDHVPHRIPVRDPDNVLVDDGASVQVRRDVVRRGADDLHPAIVRAVVRIASLEGGQETVVDVDGVGLVPPAEVVREDLHVPREHHHVDVVLLQKPLDLGLLLQLEPHLLVRGRARVLPHGEVVEGDPELLSDVTQVVVVAYDERNLALQLLAVLPQEDVVQAVVELADEDRHPLGLVAEAQAPLHVEPIGHALDRGLQPHERRLRVAQVAVRVVEVEPLKEEPRVWTGVLVRLNDVAPLAVQHRRGRGDHALGIRAVDQQGRLHGHLLQVDLDLVPLPAVVRGLVPGRDVAGLSPPRARPPPQTPPTPSLGRPHRLAARRNPVPARGGTSASRRALRHHLLLHPHRPRPRPRPVLSLELLRARRRKSGRQIVSEVQAVNARRLRVPSRNRNVAESSETNC
mmetsp:Transcript_1414/g.4068  ORF Transcript_1414/g.4068 Transcript_1414/m.4068 type:complete len:448 (+) Transcript_1414:2110-3453(+)